MCGFVPHSEVFVPFFLGSWPQFLAHFHVPKPQNNVIDEQMFFVLITTSYWNIHLRPLAAFFGEKIVFGPRPTGSRFEQKNQENAMLGLPKRAKPRKSRKINTIHRKIDPRRVWPALKSWGIHEKPIKYCKFIKK